MASANLDASLLAHTDYTSLEPDELQTDFADGFIETHRRPSLRDGFGAAFWDDGSLRHFGLYEDGACLSSLDLHPPSERGLFRQGRAMRTGEIYDRGTIETLSPWSDNEVARATDQSYADWVREYVAAVRKASGG